MQPLNEEENVVEVIPLPPPSEKSDQTDHANRADALPPQTEIKSTAFLNGSKEKLGKLSNEKTCTERSDSGFSDCSNSSNGNTALNVHTSLNVAVAHPLLDKVNLITEERSSNEQNQRDNAKDFSGKMSVNMLKMKLEKIAEAQQDSSKNLSSNKKAVKKLSVPFVVETTDTSDEVYVVEKCEMQQMRTSYSFDFEDADFLNESEVQPKSLPVKPAQKTLMRSASLHQKRIVEKEPIMKSDFTNTIKMRKKSLESNALREKQLHSQRVLLEPSGKVSKLLRRFDSQNPPANGSPVENEPIIQSPGIEDDSKEIIQKDLNKDEIAKADDEVVEILSTPMAAAQKSLSPVRKSPSKSAKTIVSSGGMKRTIATKQVHEYTNTKTCVTSMEVKVSQRHSPTKFSNAQNATITRLTPKAILNQTKNTNALKKSNHKSTTADPTAVSVQRASRTASSNKASAYSSFNRTSPVRLSGRVKEVTDRLSAPKANVKAPSPPIRDRLDVKTSPKHLMAHALEHHAQEHHHQMAMKAMSGTIVTVAESVIETEHHVEHTINGKIDGTFTLKSKMNENFRKASAFWKAT